MEDYKEKIREIVLDALMDWKTAKDLSEGEFIFSREMCLSYLTETGLLEKAAEGVGQAVELGVPLEQVLEWTKRDILKEVNL